MCNDYSTMCVLLIMHAEFRFLITSSLFYFVGEECRIYVFSESVCTGVLVFV